MAWYRLVFGGVEIGDEMIVPLGVWTSSSTKTSAVSASLDPVLSIDDRPAGLIVRPRFRVRKKAASAVEFERWLFELAGWVAGDRRWLVLASNESAMVAEYGYCRLESVERPEPKDASAGRWSDEVIVTFTSEVLPTFG